MTEEEAKTKWCHVSMAPMYVQQMPTFGAISASVELRKCTASACMAWRWSNEEVLPSPPYNAYTRPSKTEGHCGLAGKS